MNHRALLEDLFRASLDAVGGRSAVRHALEHDPIHGEAALVAVGKAADSMTRGALDVLGNRLVSGLVITKHGHLSDACRGDERLTCLEASHPVPDGTSLEAGQSLLEFLASLPPEQELLVLISGGASSLAEVLPDGFGADHLRVLNQWLLGRHLDIARMNQVRRAVSCIKGGRLALRLGRRRTRLLLISDVPGDDPAVIGSGLLVPAGEERTFDLPDGLPDWVARAVEKVPPMPEPDHPAFAAISRQIVASNGQARDAAARRARQLDLPVVNHPEMLDGDALEAGERIAEALIHGFEGVHIWGGETTVALPANPGRGGRAQALALRAALVLEGRHGLWLLSAGTDGTDGPGEDAGALVDTETCFRGRQSGLDPDTCLDGADSGRFLEASGDLLRTGPTGTNVMDVVIGLKGDTDLFP